MPDRVQDLTNHRKVAVACKNYTDKEVKKAKDELITFFSRNTVDTDDHTNELAYQITAPSGAKLLQLQAIGGNTVKLSPSVASDSTKAMIKTMPSTVYTFDGSKFEGDSITSENLCNKANATDNRNGFAFSITENCILSLSGAFNDTTTGDINFGYGDTISLQNKTYYLKTFLLSGSALSNYFKIAYDLLKSDDSVEYVSNAINSYSTTITNTNGTYKAIRNIRIYIKSQDLSSISGVSVNASYGIFLKEGSEPTQWEAHFDNIHNIELTGIKSEGYNKAGLVDVAETTGTNSVTYKVQDNVVSFKGTNTASVSSGILLELKNNIPAGTYSIGLFNNAFDTSQDVRLRFNYSDNSIKDLYINSSNYSNNNVVLEKEVVSLYIRLGTFSNSSWVEFKVTLALGTTSPTDFVPYVTPTTKTIDLTTIVDSNNNKLFPNGKLMGYNDLKDVLGVYNQQSKWDEVDIGLQTIEATGIDTHTFKITLSSAKAPSDNDTLAKLLMANYEAVTYNSISTSGDMTMALRSDNVFVIRNNAYSTAESFKTAMSGVMLQFERNTYLTSNTDLSATLRNIQGYPNGSIIAENTNNMDVESVITYNSIIQETLCPSITVDGANMLNPQNTFTYSAYTDLAYFECVGGATYTLKSFGSYTGSFGIFKYDGSSWSSIEAHSLNNGYTITAPSDAIRIGVNGVVSQNVMVVRGSTAPTTFKPYKASITRNLPTQASDGYGVNSDAHNLRVFSDYEGNAVNKRYTNVNKDTLGSYNYTYESSWGAGADFYINSVDTPTMKKPSDNDTSANVMSPNYTNVSRNTMYNNSTDMVMSLLTGGAFKFRNNLYDDATIFKTAMANEPLYYELADASKTETSIDDFDFFFDVEEGDVITFNNSYAQQVYATYSFIIKEAKSNE